MPSDLPLQLLYNFEFHSHLLPTSLYGPSSLHSAEEMNSDESLQRVDNLWFDETLIVIRAQKSLFRVSRNTLALQSPIFADMLRVPQPSDAEMMDGIPVVEIQDTAEDATVFFRAIFDSSFFEAYPTPTKFSILFGILQLSTKYEVDHLRRRALVHLSSLHARSLDELDIRRSGDATAWQLPSFLILGRDPLRVSLIRLCQEFDAPWMLPVAFYMLAGAYDAVEILNGITDGQSVLHLDDIDRKCFFKGYPLQQRATMNIIRFLYSPIVVNGCTSRERCILVNDDVDDAPTDPLGIWSEEDWDRLAEMCSSCNTVLRELHRQARQEFWDGLHATYDLPSWEELRKLKEAAIGVF
ncbi:hypothetical protein C8R43DRAFT_1178299 [Mycena crocata]|nr:hypothetical protein C8R43DRAFT_1178299 [Mycena crocata]